MPRLAAIVLAALVLASLPVVPSPAAAAAGWRQVYRDDFSGTTLHAAFGRYGGPHGGPSASHYRPDDAYVSGGLLRLRMQRRSYGGRPYTTGGVGMFRIVQTFGRYEFRAKAPLGRGIDAYATLWPADEGNADRNATLIEIIPRPGDEKAHLTNWYGTGNTGRVVPGRYSDGFHTFVIEWSPQQFRILIDGTARLVDRRVSRVRKWLGFAVSSGDNLTGLPDAQTRLPAEFQIDWVRVDAYAPGQTPSAAPSRSLPAPGGSTTGPPAASSSDDAVTAVAMGEERRGGALWPLAAAGGLAVVVVLFSVAPMRRRLLRRLACVAATPGRDSPPGEFHGLQHDEPGAPHG